MKDKLILFIAQGFGVGRIPFAPGTFGSVLGLGWFALLLATGNVWLFALGTLLGLAASVWFCGKAEKILGQTDPGSVVLDEIAAMPVCFAGLVILLHFLESHFSNTLTRDYQAPRPLPEWKDFFSRSNWLMGVLVFSAFRFFDIIKPWPVKQSQKLPGGWGVTVDDFLAALYVNICSFAVIAALLLILVSEK